MGKGTAGKLSKVTIGPEGGLVIIAGLDTHDFKESADKQDDSEYGINAKKFLPTLQDPGAGKIEGKMREDDAGQLALAQYKRSGALIPDLRLYFGPNIYVTSDLAADPDAGALIDNLQYSNTIQGVIKVSFNYQFSGPIKEVRV